jgi:hypothetical protein
MDHSASDLDRFEEYVMTPSMHMRREPPASQLMIEMKELDMTLSMTLDKLINPSDVDVAAVCNHVINKIVKKTYPSFNFVTDKEEELITTVELKWCDIEKCVRELLPRGSKKSFSASTWRRHFYDTLKGAKSIIFKGKCPGPSTAIATTSTGTNTSMTPEILSITVIPDVVQPQHDHAR